jgi:predicted ATP-grasp superfamily ATP-dependent carboligase
MGSRGAVLIAAASGRALAASARRARYVPLVADYFADQDTVAMAGACVRLSNGLAAGMQADALLPALEKLATAHEPIGVVCGTGFEDRPDLLAAISERWTLLGNGAATVGRAKDPLAFAQICLASEIPHPAVTFDDPPNRAVWLKKRSGGAGGTHIAPPGAAGSSGSRYYFQRRVSGDAISALFAADGTRALILGFSEQWASPTPQAPFRYGGADQPAEIGPRMLDALTGAIHRLVEALPLVGLNSADFIVDGETFWLLEVNPRPGATLDIFDRPDASLLGLHMAACARVLPSDWPAAQDAAASAIVYATHDIASFPTLQWLDWATDRPHPGTIIRAGEPLCSVHASASSAIEARRLVHRRVESILATANARLA